MTIASTIKGTKPALDKKLLTWFGKTEPVRIFGYYHQGFGVSLWAPGPESAALFKHVGRPQKASVVWTIEQAALVYRAVVQLDEDAQAQVPIEMAIKAHGGQDFGEFLERLIGVTVIRDCQDD